MKGADQHCSICQADQRLCFRLYKVCIHHDPSDDLDLFYTKVSLGRISKVSTDVLCEYRRENTNVLYIYIIERMRELKMFLLKQNYPESLVDKGIENAMNLDKIH